MEMDFIDYIIALKRIVKHESTYEWLDAFTKNHRELESPEYQKQTLDFARETEKLMDGFEKGKYKEISYNALEDCFVAIPA